MNIFSSAFNTFLYRPLFNSLILLYEYLPGKDFGFAVIVLTFILRMMLFPLMSQTIKYQKIMTEIQPKVKEIQERLKDDQEKQMKEIMALYKEKKISPFSVFIPLLIQLPLLIALFRVFSAGISSGEIVNLYSFVPNPGEINYLFLNIVSLSSPNIILTTLAAATQFFQVKTQNQKTKTKKNKKNNSMAQFSAISQKQMPYLLSGFTFIFLLKAPSALSLYLIVTSLFSIGQQRILKKHA
jgi:YidC/Oxa1 family membrane protein insertase